MRAVICFLFAAAAAAAPAYEIPSGTVWAFNDSIGINTHFSQSATVYYTNFTLAQATLVSLGVKHFRDSIETDGTNATYWSRLNTLVSAGFLGDYISFAESGPDPATFIANVPSIVSFEDYNEPDINYPSWQAMVTTQLPFMWSIGQSNSIPILGPSLIEAPSYTALGNISSNINYVNIHPYPGGLNPESTNPTNTLAGYIPDAQISYPGGPVQATETGYWMNTSTTGYVSQDTAATYMPRIYLHYWNLGIKRTYVYELMDDVDTPDMSGLADGSGTPREQFTAVQNLFSLLSDVSTVFTPAGLNFIVTGNGAGAIEHTLLQKSDSTYWLALWQPVSVWDISTSMPVTVSPYSLNLAWVGLPRGYEIYQFNSNGTVTDGGAQSGQSTAVSVGAAVTLVRIGQAGQTASPGVTVSGSVVLTNGMSLF